jgi:hypothetical protein
VPIGALWTLLLFRNMCNKSYTFPSVNAQASYRNHASRTKLGLLVRRKVLWGKQSQNTWDNPKLSLRSTGGRFMSIKVPEDG